MSILDKGKLKPDFLCALQDSGEVSCSVVKSIISFIFVVIFTILIACGAFIPAVVVGMYSFASL